MLVFDEQLYQPHASRWWGEFAGMDRSKFQACAAELKRMIAMLRKVVAAGAGLS